MKQYFFLALLSLSIVNINCQHSLDTTYLNSKWEQTDSQNYSYYRVYYQDSNGLFNCQDYWKNGTLQMTGQYASFEPQIREGEFTYYHRNGKLREKQQYQNNYLTGTVSLYDSNGLFDLSYCPYIDSLDNPNDIQKFIPKLLRHVKKNLEYPAYAAENEIECNITTLFYVSPEGKLDRFTTSSCSEESLIVEAKRVLESFNKWPVAYYNGNPIHLYFTMPINFKIN